MELSLDIDIDILAQLGGCVGYLIESKLVQCCSVVCASFDITGPFFTMICLLHTIVVAGHTPSIAPTDNEKWIVSMF